MKPTSSTNLLLTLAFSPLLALAHSHPKTPEQVEVQRALQAAAYHCAPAVAAFTAARRQSWAQRVLAGNPSLPNFNDLFLDGNYDTSSAGYNAEGQSLMSCTPVVDTHIENNTCVLAPETVEGPYYHSSGHIIRQNIAEYQLGLLTHLDIGVIDVETCLPMPNVLVDIWHANATGHYAGHPLPAPHLVDEKPQVGGKRSGLLSAYPRTIEEENWLRGAWETDRNGVSQFTTTFPGYYTGRALHIHTKVYTEWDPLPNGSFVGGKLVHTGQFFFEDELVTSIDKIHPYTENPIRNTIGRTRNWRDSLNIFEEAQGPEGKYNPVFGVHFLGGVLQQGVLGFITMGINGSASYKM